ncbi:PSP1 C-terminal conserved region-domain-containing protein [Zopfochytrium polystomum]|nr:PSP1 C-terminal conserved region-domain-containing protein [Zopfochytrium polystomum]
MERRHSAAAHGRLHANLHSIPDKENFDVEDPIYADVNDYFENTEYRTKALQLAASNSGNNNKPLPATPTQHTWPLFAIEFKAGRIEYFYLPEQSMSVGAVKTGDLVLVEADRGKDLGKVAFDSIMNHEELAEFRMQHPDATATVTSSDGGVVARDLQPKRIIRRAIQSEVALLVLKSQDEAKAMGVCQTKIRQKKLPMEVVDAEFQWDRRKLTFYFVADRRIDFRELVRDLFKLYKTRIWMCAVVWTYSCSYSNLKDPTESL